MADRILGGGCHCGNLGVVLEWPADTLVPVRCCGCSFCRKHAGSWTSHPQASLTLRVRERADLSRYRFGTGTADFLICARCGLVPVAVSRIDGRDYAVVNVRTLQLDPAQQAPPEAADFDGEDVAQRLKRRRRNWIGRVRIEFSDGV